MPSLASYTPFESLLFFQSLASLDSRPASFGPISEFLKNNQFVQQDAAFDVRRLAPEALEELYRSVVNEKPGSGEASTPKDGRDAKGPVDQPSSPKKRKLSPTQDSVSHNSIISKLVSRLYAKYKECVTAELRQGEKRYGELKDEVRKLEDEGRVPSPTSTTQTAAVQAPSNVTADASSVQGPQPTIGMGGGPIAPVASEAPPPAATSRGLPNIQPSPSTGSYDVQVQAPKPPTRPLTTGTVPTGSPGVPQMTTTSENQAQTMPPTANVPNAPQFHPKVPTPQNAQTVKFQPPWTPKTAPQPSQIPPYVPQSNHQIPAQHQQQPIAPNIASFSETSQPPLVPIAPRILPALKTDVPTQPYAENRQPAFSNFESPGQPQAPTSLPSFAKSLNQRPLRPSLDMSSIQTPWKTPTPILTANRPSSPIRPRPEDISPISERSFSPVHELHLPQGKGRDRAEAENFSNATELSKPPAASTRSRNATPRLSKKDPKHTPSPSRGRSRGRSTASHMGDSSLRKVKQEVPSTPIGITHDGELVPHTMAKRKRTPSGMILEDTQGSSQTRDQYIICTRTFPRTCAPVMNDIAAHKHASIFAKPLTNRDAPGYKDLIYRSQDIKSIKSAIHQGSKAVAAASEAMNTPGGDTDSPATGLGTPAKNGGLMLKKSAEIVPPKAIVNSSQLEKELIRMFANAIMFNPTPERTFGPSFPMRSDSTPRGEIHSAEAEEGGIINDTLEMFEDVEQAVSTWRAAERTVDDVGSKNS